MRRQSIDMTSGPIWKQMLLFAVPLLLGEVLQQLYAMVDSVMLGQLAGSAALAAVGAADSVVNVLVGFFTGLSVGCTVVIAQIFGKKDEKQLHAAVHTVVAVTFFCGLLLTGVGVALCRIILRLMDVPGDVLEDAARYLTIYFGGLIGLVMYNIFAGIMRAVGNSRQPLYFLFFSSALNIALDYVFIAWFRLGVAGAAYATVLSQSLSALLCFGLLLRTGEPWGFSFRERIQVAYIRAMVRHGVPIGLQKTINSLSNVILLSAVAYFGTSVLSGYTIYRKVHHVSMCVTTAVGSAGTTFISQNFGARDLNRCRRGLRVTLSLSMLLQAILVALTLLFHEPVIHLFGRDEAMFDAAKTILFTIMWAQLLHAVMIGFVSALRGYGHAAAGTLCMIGGLVVGRQLYLTAVRLWANSLRAVCFSIPVGWILSATLMIPTFYVLDRRHQREFSEASNG